MSLLTKKEYHIYWDRSNILLRLFSILGLPRVEWKSQGCCYISGIPFVLLWVFTTIYFFLLIEQQHSSNQIDQEREGEKIDRALLKNVLNIYVKLGMGLMDFYENSFEAAMLKDTSAYYSRKASNWIIKDSCPDYMLKVSILRLQPLNSAFFPCCFFCMPFFRLNSIC